ncbi:MAG TPA: ABC transporter permease [Ilumatobacteraceae bacterium]|nr:ABC transporter permease [Ilumatobacteraceae bacterium]
MAHPLPTLSAARIVAGLQIRRRLRDRSALLQGVIAPIVLAVIIATAFGGGRSFSTEIGVVDLDGGDLGAALVAGAVAPVEDDGHEDDGSEVELVALRDRSAAERAIDGGDLPAAIVIPDGFAASLAPDGAANPGRPDPLAVEVLVDPGRELPSDVAVAIATRLAASVESTRLTATTALTADPALAVDPGTDAIIADASRVGLPVTLGATAFGEGFDPITYFAPSMAILFAFLTLGAGARTIIVERREGTLARIRSTPISDRAVLAGVTASVVLVGLVSFIVIWVVTSVVFGADWGDPAGVLLVILATVLAVAGISTLVTGFARTEAQADGATSVLAFGFVLIGGGFVSPGDLPDALARVALITPNRWALDAFAELAAGASGIPAVLTPVLVLTGIGLVTGAIGLRRTNLGAP